MRRKQLREEKIVEEVLVVVGYCRKFLYLSRIRYLNRLMSMNSSCPSEESSCVRRRVVVFAAAPSSTRRGAVVFAAAPTSTRRRVVVLASAPACTRRIMAVSEFARRRFQLNFV